MTFDVRQGDCVELMAAMPAGSVDAICTDPPYGLGFMGKEWDNAAALHLPPSAEALDTPLARMRTGKGPAAVAFDGHAFQAWCQTWAAEALRVLKPGGHLLAFGGTRTYHRLACAVEDAGFEIRDTICWLYGSGFPKSLDVGKAIDKRRDWSLVERLTTEIGRARTEAGLSLTEMGEAMQAATDGQYGSLYHRGGFKFFETGSQLPSRPEWDCLRDVLPIAEGFREVYEAAEREVVGEGFRADTGRMAQGEGGYAFGEEFDVTVPATPEAERWEGWGTALAPAHEPIVVARKPLSGTVASTVLEWGTGAINIDASRVNSGQSPSTMQRCPLNGPAPHAAQLSGWHPVALPEAKVPTALALAATQPEGDPVLLIRIGEVEDSYGRMAMSPSDTKAITNSSTGSSWKPNSAGRSNGASTSITETAIGLTTDPAILSFCRSAHTLLSTIRAVTPLGGCECAAWPVVESSSDGGWKWSDIPLRIAPVRASAPLGRWPKNVVLDGEAARLLDKQTGAEVSQFFYCSKAGREERSKGLNGDRSNHPTVKPIQLMRWLVRLVTPPGGTVLDPFTGSGTTGCAAVLEGFDFIGLEREAEYVDIARARIGWWHKHRGDGEAAEILVAGELRDAVEATGQSSLFD